MKLFITSNIGGIKKENGKKIPVKLFENNNFLNNIKKSLIGREKFVLVASDPDSYEKNDMYLQIDIEALKLSDLVFNENVILDGRSKNIELVLKNADLIILCGGNTLTQNIFFNSINLKEYIKDINCVIVGISAGSINSAEHVFNSPESEEDLKNNPYLKGLGLTNINIEPHFVLEDDSNKIKRDAIIKESYNRPLIALTDGAYILQSSRSCKLYGKSYRIKDGKIDEICKDNQFINLLK